MPKQSTARTDLASVHGRGKLVERAADGPLFSTHQRPAVVALPRHRAPAATPAPAVRHAAAIAQMPIADYEDEGATEIDGPLESPAHKKWLDTCETIPYDPSMRMLGEGTPPRAVPPVRVDTSVAPHHHDNDATRREPRVDVTPRPGFARSRRAQATPPRADATPSPRSMPLAAPTPTPYPAGHSIPLYGAPALPPHVPTAMALPPQSVMPTQVAAQPPLPPTHVATQYPQAHGLVRPYRDGVTPYPVPQWASGQHAAVPQAGYVLPTSHHLDIYGDTEERSVDTDRVNNVAAPSPRRTFARIAIPAIGGLVAIIVVAGYVLSSGRGAQTPTPPQPVAAPVAIIAEPAATVTPIAEPQLPDPSWKPRENAPTIVAQPAVAAAQVVDETHEIEMTPMAAPKPKAKPSSRRAKRAQIAAIAKAIEKRKSVARKSDAKPATQLAKSAPRERDPILDEIEKPAKTAVAATGPGKLAITSSVPALIYIDGRSTNLMTPKTLNLAPGPHKVTLLELTSRKAKTSDIVVAAGKVATLDKTF